jgi:hypothetical protein
MLTRGGDEARPALVLVREHEHHVAFADVLAAIHRLLRRERERLRPLIANLRFDRECHGSPLANQCMMPAVVRPIAAGGLAW